MAVQESQGTALKIGDDSSPEGFTIVGRVISFDGPGGSASEIDVSDLQSTAKEFIVGLPDEGTFSFEMNLDFAETTQATLRSVRNARTKRSFRLDFSGDSPINYLGFEAFVMEFKVSGGVDGAVKASCTLRISGAVTWGTD
jgi:hypothetical protein